MSNVITAPFSFEPTKDKRWTVNLDGTAVVVQSLSEAELLAYMPVEHSKLHSDVLGKPDVSRVRKIVVTAARYSYTSPALRQLEIWLSGQSFRGKK